MLRLKEAKGRGFLKLNESAVHKETIMGICSDILARILSRHLNSFQFSCKDGNFLHGKNNFKRFFILNDLSNIIINWREL